ncbi:MAG: hypothetical protein GF388_11375 [Candidatus Aegiribacteria sp.]|nr:hypothetical protein [Candidatus Aegiribacteria sp.]MBD3295594.1 hypothetical protein [Candidatus Fermentibacteria bacterium]
MTSLPSRKGYIYGYVRGLSMWPVLIPGDILRTKPVGIHSVKQGDIVVLDQRASKPVVHRVDSIQMTKGMILLRTSGDRSGEDPCRKLEIHGELLKVFGVLRNRKWMKPCKKASAIFRIVPQRLVRTHCRIVREFFW